MRNTVWSGLAICALAALAGGVASSGTPAWAQRSTGPAAFSQTGELLAFSTPDEQGQGQTLVVVDSRERVVGVYHIDAKGEIALRSVRNIDADLKLTEFNGVSPLPHEIHSMLQRSRASVAAKP